MVQLTAREVAGYYQAEGGPMNRVVAWTAVSKEESSYDTRAESPVGARGLYQFMPYSWPAQLGSFDNAWDPWANTRAMLILSGGGMNFAPWDSCYLDILATGRYSYLPWPQTDSAVWLAMPGVAADIGRLPENGLDAPSMPGIDGTLARALSWYGQATHTVIPQMTKRALRLSAQARRLYVLGGWLWVS